MAQLPIDEAVGRFRSNEERFNEFVNGSDGYVSTDGQPVESVSVFLQRQEQEIEQITGTVASNLLASQSARTGAETARDLALAARTGAETARDLALAARDAAVLNSTMYPDEVTGRAAVVDNAYFKVIGSQDVACLEYRRINASTSVLIASYPSTNALTGWRDQGFVGTDALSIRPASVAVFGDVTARTELNGRVRMDCPSGASFSSSYILWLPDLTPAEIGYGKMLVEAVFEHTSGVDFTTIFNDEYVQRWAVGWVTSNISVNVVQLDATRVRIWAEVTTAANDVMLRGFIQSGATAPQAYYIKLLSSRVINLDAGGVEDSADRRELAQRNKDAAQSRAIEVAAAYIPPISALAIYAVNGATAITNGLRIAQNTGGGTSFISSMMENDVNRINRIVGKQVKLRALVQVTDRYRLGGCNTWFLVGTSGGSTDNQATRNWLSNTLLELTYDLTVPSNLTSLEFFAQFNSPRTQVEADFDLVALEIGYRFNSASNTYDQINAVRTESALKYSRGVPVVPNGKTVISPPVALFNGAVALPAPDIGYTIPVGQTGQTTYYTMPLPLLDEDFAKFNGKRVRITAYAEVENYIERTYNLGFNLSGSAAGTNHGITTSYDSLRKMFVSTCECTVTWTPGDLTASVQPYVMNGAASAATSVMKFKIIGTFWEPVSSTFETAADQKFAEPFPVLSVRRQIELERTKRQFKPGLGYKVITVNSDPAASANFVGRTALADAIASIKDATADNQYEIQCTGTFHATELSHFNITQYGIPSFIVPKDYVHMVGKGMAYLIGKMPDGTGDVVDVLHFDAIARMENFTVYATNLNYACHFEGAGATPNIERVFRNVHLKFNGPTGKVALGYGSSSGERFYAEDSTFESSGGGAIYIHNNANFQQSCLWHLRNCRVIGGGVDGDAVIIGLHSIGSGQKDVLRLEDTVVDDGAIQFQDYLWRNTNVPTSDADHADIELVAADIEPRAISHGYANTCLKFTSKSTGESSTVSFDPNSSAFNYVIGNSSLTIDFENEFWRTQQYGYDRKAGGVGMRGFAISRLDISDYSWGGSTPYAHTLGKRLGDCTGTTKTLTVYVDGTAYNVVFNKNYNNTGDTSPPQYTNQQIVNEILAVIGTVCDVSLYAFAVDHYPVFRGNLTCKNSDSTAVLAGMGVIRTGQNKVRIATNSDGRIDGIALDDIAPEKKGRVITCGEIYAANKAARFVKEKL